MLNSFDVNEIGPFLHWSHWYYKNGNLKLDAKTIKKILVIDDDLDFHKFIEKALDSPDFNIIVAKDSEQAMIKLNLVVPDLILVDINLPDTDGLKLSRFIKKLDDFKNIPIMAISSDKSKILGESLSTSIVDEFEMKPINIKRLKHKIERILY